MQRRDGGKRGGPRGCDWRKQAVVRAVMASIHRALDDRRCRAMFAGHAFVHRAWRRVMGCRAVRSVRQAAHTVVASHRVRSRRAREQREGRGEQRDDHEYGLHAAHRKKGITIQAIWLFALVSASGRISGKHLRWKCRRVRLNLLCCRSN